MFFKLHEVSYFRGQTKTLMKILVIQKKFMGDVLMTSTLFRSLKEKFPEAELHYLIGKNSFPVIQNHEYIDKIIYFENRFFKTLKSVQKEKYNVILDAYSKVETGLFSLFTQPKKSIGFYKKYTSFLYTNPVRRKEKASSELLTTGIEHRLQLLEPLGISYKIQKPEIFISQNEKDQAESLLKKLGINFSKKIVMLSTFGSTAEKSYPYIHSVIEKIAEQDVQILCNYLPNQKEDFLKIYTKLSKQAQDKVFEDFDTKNLREFIAVISFCNALIGNEGGATNISKALDIPTFSIFAPFINKYSWNWFEDGIKNDSAHITDFLVDSFDYEQFKPELFTDKLTNFLKNNLS